MKNERISIALVSALSLFSVNVALADEPPPAAEEQSTTTTTTTTTTPSSTPSDTQGYQPEPGTVPPPAAAQPQAAPCGPLAYSRTDRDYSPGKTLRITGGLMIGFGLATIAVGAGVAGWAGAHDPTVNTSQQDLDNMIIGGSVAAGIGGVSLIAGIPMVVEGVRQGRAARERQFTVAPSFVVPRGGGAMAGLGGKF